MNTPNRHRMAWAARQAAKAREQLASLDKGDPTDWRSRRRYAKARDALLASEARFLRLASPPEHDFPYPF